MPDDTDHPLATLAGAERAIDPIIPPVEAEKPVEPAPVEETPAADRLRAFEDEKLGPDAPRFAGQVERGVGSLYNRMPEADKAHHAKLEKLIEAETKLAEAETALVSAKLAHGEALKAAADAPASE